MGTFLLTHITAEGSFEDIDQMVSCLSSSKGSINKLKLEEISGRTLSFNLDEQQRIRYSPYNLTIKGKLQKRQRALLVETYWHSRDFDDVLMYELAAFFPTLTWKIYTDDLEQSAVCDMYELGLKSSSVSIVHPEYSAFVNSKCDHKVDVDAIKNKLDSMFFCLQDNPEFDNPIVSDFRKSESFKSIINSDGDALRNKVAVQTLVITGMKLTLALNSESSDLTYEIEEQLEKILPKYNRDVDLLALRDT